MNHELSKEMQTMVNHMNEANEALTHHFLEAQHEKETLRAEHRATEKLWQEEMDKLNTSYKALITDFKLKHRKQQQSALNTVEKLKKSQSSEFDSVTKIAQLREAHEDALAQVHVRLCIHCLILFHRCHFLFELADSLANALGIRTRT